MKFSYDGILVYQNSFGGEKEDRFTCMTAESDYGFTAAGITYSYPTPGNQLNVFVVGSYFLCEAGYYNSSAICAKCPVGTYSTERGVDECTGCAAGFYQPSQAQKSCIACPSGTYQSSTSQSACLQCSIGTYNANTGSSLSTACTECAEGYYQDTTGQSSCKTCATNYYPNLLKTSCLYKGIFSTEALFTSSAFKTNCFDSLGNIVIPYTAACRTSYRDICCLGSSTLSAGPICNFGLEIASTSSLYNKYCSACLFMDQTQCPDQGVCWSDSSTRTIRIIPIQVSALHVLKL